MPSPYLKKCLPVDSDLKYNLNINIVAQIRGEYKVYKPSYILISEFFSLRGPRLYIFLSLLDALPVRA